MRVQNLYLGKYGKSLNKTKKVIRTISKDKPYIHKQTKQEAEAERKIQVYLKKQKEIEREVDEKLNSVLEDLEVSHIQRYALLIYGLKLEKEKVIELLKARKAK